MEEIEQAIEALEMAARIFSKRHFFHEMKTCDAAAKALKESKDRIYADYVKQLDELSTRNYKLRMELAELQQTTQRAIQ